MSDGAGIAIVIVGACIFGVLVGIGVTLDRILVELKRRKRDSPTKREG